MSGFAFVDRLDLELVLGVHLEEHGRYGNLPSGGRKLDLVDAEGILRVTITR